MYWWVKVCLHVQDTCSEEARAFIKRDIEKISLGIGDGPCEPKGVVEGVQGFKKAHELVVVIVRPNTEDVVDVPKPQQWMGRLCRIVELWCVWMLFIGEVISPLNSNTLHLRTIWYGAIYIRIHVA